jgi:putative transposase
MIIRKAFKFALTPNGAQIRKMQQFCGCARFVFNKALAWQMKD